MTKQEFIEILRKELSGLPQGETEERLNFYIEMIEDRIEEGFSEEEAVSAVGTVDEIKSQIVANIPLAKIAKERIKRQRRLKSWEFICLVLGSPIWLSLIIAAVAVIFSLYVSLWSVIISLWAVFVSLIGCAFGGVATGIGFVCCGYGITGIAVVGVGAVLSGLSIFAFCGCKSATKGILTLTKTVLLRIKNCFIKKEEL